VERLTIVSQPSAEPVHDPLDPLRRDAPVLGDAGDGSPLTVAVAVAVFRAVFRGASVRMPVSGDAVPVSTVHLLAVPVRHHRIREFHPADTAHLIGKNTSEQNEVFRVLEIRQGRKHPQIGDLSR